MARKVWLPRDIEGKLDNLTRLVEEVNGVIFYRRQGDDCRLEEIFMTGVGSEWHVRAQSERAKVVNEFLRRNPDYRFVKFHTHSKGTIEKFGEYYAQKFSHGDIDGIKKQLKDDRDFMAMLVTPEKKLLCGIDNPELVRVNDFPEYQNRNKAVSEALEVIAKNLGYDINKFQATIKK